MEVIRLWCTQELSLVPDRCKDFWCLYCVHIGSGFVISSSPNLFKPPSTADINTFLLKAGDT